MRFWSSISRGLCRKRSTLAASSSILLTDACSAVADAMRQCTAMSAAQARRRAAMQVVAVQCSCASRHTSYARHAALRGLSA